MLFLLYLVIAGVAGTYIFRKRMFGTALPLSLLLHVSFVLIFGLFFGHLKVWVYAGFIMYFCVFANEIRKCVQHRKISDISMSQTHILIFVIVYAVLFYLNSKQGYIEWDEFSHWGPMIKEMFRLDNFYFMSDRTFGHKDYVPYVTLFEYVACLMHGSYSESIVYQAIQILMVSCFMPLLAQIEYHFGKIKGLVLNIISVLSVYVFLVLVNTNMYFSFFHSIYTDMAFGILCGLAIAHAYYRRRESFLGGTNNTVVLLAMETTLLSIAVIMTKMVGIALFPAILVFDFLILYKGKTIKEKLEIVVAQIFVPILIWLLYKHKSSKYLSLSGDQSFDGAYNKLLQLFTRGYTYEYQDQVSRTYRHAILRDQNFTLITSRGTYIPLVVAIICCCVIMMVLTYCIHRIYLNASSNNSSDERRVNITCIWKKKDFDYVIADIWRSGLWLVIGLFILALYYLLLMFLLYEVSFSEYEALTLASFHRYMFIVISAIGVAVIYFFADLTISYPVHVGVCTGKKISKKDYCALTVIIIGLIIMFWYDGASGRFKEVADWYWDNETKVNRRDGYRQVAELILDNIDDESSIAFLVQNSNGFEYIHFNYYLMDKILKTETISAKVGAEKIKEDDVWSRVLTKADFLDLVSQYDCLYIYSFDDEFQGDYGDLFDKKIETGDIYTFSKNKLRFSKNVYTEE